MCVLEQKMHVQPTRKQVVIPLALLFVHGQAPRYVLEQHPLVLHIARAQRVQLQQRDVRGRPVLHIVPGHFHIGIATVPTSRDINVPGLQIAQGMVVNTAVRGVI